MSRVIQLRVRGLPAHARERLHECFGELVAGREWRGGSPWLADRLSAGVLAQMFFEQAQAEAHVSAHDRPLGAAAFVRIAGDEADALALAFIAREISERCFTRQSRVRGGRPDPPGRRKRPPSRLG